MGEIMFDELDITIFVKHNLTTFVKHNLTVFVKHNLTIIVKHWLTIFANRIVSLSFSQKFTKNVVDQSRRNRTKVD